jgi:hypothetical protein
VHLLCSGSARDHDELPRYINGPADRFRLEAVVNELTFAQADRFFELMEDRNRVIGIDPNYEEPDRVRAYIHEADRGGGSRSLVCHSAVRLLCLDIFRLSAALSPMLHKPGLGAEGSLA